jgi:hypothetical protein
VTLTRTKTLHVGRALPADCVTGGQWPPYIIYGPELTAECAAGALTGGISAPPKTAGEGTGGTMVRGADPTD